MVDFIRFKNTTKSEVKYFFLDRDAPLQESTVKASESHEHRTEALRRLARAANIALKHCEGYSCQRESARIKSYSEPYNKHISLMILSDAFVRAPLKFCDQILIDHDHDAVLLCVIKGYSCIIVDCWWWR